MAVGLLAALLLAIVVVGAIVILDDDGTTGAAGRSLARGRVVNVVSDAVVGMGPIEFLLKDLEHAR